MKKVLGFVLAAGMCISLAACGQGKQEAKEAGTATVQSSGESKAETSQETEAAKEPRDAYFIAVMTGGAAWSQAERGFNDACEELGWNGYYLAPVERNNATEMANLLDSAITAKGDVIIGAYNNIDMMGDALLRARENGAITAAVQLTLDEKYIDFQIGTDQDNMGKVRADTVKMLADENGALKVLYIQTQPGEIANAQYAAFLENLKDREDIEVVDMVFDNGSAITAAELVADYYKIYPELNCIMCCNSSAATMGAANFVEENGLQGKVLAVGVDASADILNYVKSGALVCTINQDFYKIGHDSVMMAYEYLENGVKPNFKNDSGCYLIMPEEVDSYAKEAGIALN